MGSIGLDGTDDRLHTTSLPLTSPPFTVCAWIRPTSNGGSRQIWSLTANNNTFHGWYCFNNAGTLRHQAFDGADANADATTTHAIDTWHSATFVAASSTDRRTFLNAANKGTNTTSRTPSVSGGYMTVGAYQSNTGGSTVAQFFHGQMGYVFIWDRALTDSEVSDWHNGTIPQEADLVAMYDLTVAPVGGVYANQVNPGTHDLTVTGATFDSGQTPPETYTLGGGATTLERSASLSATATITAAPQRTLNRSAAITGTGTIAAAGSVQGIEERSASLTATASISTVPQRALQRTAGLSATGSIATRAFIGGGGSYQFGQTSSTGLHCISTPVTYPFTLAVWYKATAAQLAAITSIYEDGRPTTDHPRVHEVTYHGDQVGRHLGQYTATASGDYAGQTHADTEDGTWRLGVAVYAADNDRRLYLHGSKITTTAEWDLPNPADRHSIGRLSHHTGHEYPFPGRIAYRFFWRLALTDADVATLLAGDLPEPAALYTDGSAYDLTQDWGAGPVPDQTGNGNDLTITGTPAFVDDDTAPVAYAFATVHTASASLSATATITVSGSSWTTLERTASLSATGSVTVSAEVESASSTLTRTASLTATGTVTVTAYQRTLLRQASITATGSITAAPQRALIRTVAITATGTIATSGTAVGPIQSVGRLESGLSITQPESTSGILALAE